jgi:hypothetical protein
LKGALFIMNKKFPAIPYDLPIGAILYVFVISASTARSGHLLP